MLYNERSGIFNWILEGHDLVQQEKKIFETPVMLENKEQYIEDVDTIGQFMSECLIITDDENDRIKTAKMFDAFDGWRDDNNYKVITRPKFHEEMRKRLSFRKTSNDFYIKVKYTDLGLLYSDKKTMTPIQFAKAKNELLDRPATLPYNTLKTSYFKKTWAWFVEHINTSIIKGVQTERYWNYCEWCSEYGYVPIKSKDFTVKVNWLVDNLKTPSPDAVSFEGVKDIWAD